MSPHPVRRLFLEAVWLRGGGVEPRAVESSSLWEAAAALAVRSGQEPLFLDFARRTTGAARLREGTIADLESQSLYHAFRWVQVRETIEDALSALSPRGIRPVLLKGAALAGEAYDPPRLRPMRDVDILVSRVEIEEARAALVERGFRGRPGDGRSGLYADHHHLPPLFHGTTGICLELHHHIMKLPPWFEGFPEPEEFLNNVHKSGAFPGRALVLRPELQILATSIHITHGDWISRRIQNHIDLSRIVESSSAATNWGKLVAYADSPDVARSLAASLGYLEREGLPSAPTDILREIRRRSRMRPWEETFLAGLTDRYRIGAPAPWPRISGRVATILWRQTLRRAWAARRAWDAARMVLAR